ncbi:hypothetical protein BN903_168 [Halorubrum sp. AJ67]|nr:hypothetical protein BN903_168 [Halorubrum sp. AJ67]
MDVCKIIHSERKFHIVVLMYDTYTIFVAHGVHYYRSIGVGVRTCP